MTKKKELKPFELVNFYEIMPKKYIPKQHNPHFDKHHLKLPMRLILAGSSGSGKTMTLLNLLNYMPGTFEKIRIITKCKDEPLYNYLEDKMKDDDFKIEEGIHCLPDLDSLDKTQNSLFILDDLVNESAKAQKPVCDWIIRMRKKNASLIYISQSYYAIPKMIRDNINYLILKQVSSMKNLTMICRECSLGIDKKQLKDIYDDATENKTDFLLIDLETEPKNRFRKNLDQIYEVEDIM